MKFNSYSKTAIYSAIALFLLLTLFACKKDIQRFFVYDDYLYSSVDDHGGSWKGILISSPEDIAIDAFYDQTSIEYAAELEDLVQKLNARSGKIDASLKYWSNNPVLRWNEIALDLAAKYNLIPPPNPDGSYTLPTPANPAGPPKFPFAHPPYTSRMLAHLSVAQYDALIATWHYKFLHQSQRHHLNNDRIEPVFVDNELPPFPSEGSVIAEVSVRILKNMFPLEGIYLDSLYNNHLQALAYSGDFIQQDIDAGIQIGTQVASLVLQRAATDGMSQAQSPKPVSDSILQAAQDRFGWFWVNMESPVRPVGLVPLYGKVKSWSIPDIVLVRSVPPPAIGSVEFNSDVSELKEIARKLTTNQRKIANWWEDGLGSYTPPGHWNRLAKELCVKYQLNPLRTARTFAYLNMAVQDAGIACWDTKYYYHYPRPIQTIEGFKTILGTPNFPAYTSGHSTFSAAGAEVLSYVFPTEAAYCRDWAEEAAVSRIYGGIHYRFDADAGLEQGRKVAEFTLLKAKSDGAD